ncbi:His Kinase A (phospho-acceptor) domain-containing protein [Parasporobacterium paucivorans DSM 15970]|uniref:histidine kinase n=1 Tax=Parasporobacterium paucivorans DSM 15970 TaxID=1122934 RepID=A0A1M6G7K6_9FIRM|nr:His Kinase A (phospho-acceptor) domain-containing protein [Parasporobacterium paucivorans DSM 15970]
MILKEKLIKILKNKYIRSLRIRILIYILLIGIIPVLLFDIVLVRYYERTMIEQRMAQLTNQSKILKNFLNSENYLSDKATGRANIEFNQIFSLFDQRIILVDRNFRVVYDTYNVYDNKLVVSSNVLKCFDGTDSSVYYEDGDIIEFTIGLDDGNDKTINDGVMVLTYSTADIRAAISRLQDVSRVLQSVLIIVVLSYGIYISFRMVRPFKKVENTIDMISNGFFDKELSIDDYTETKRISDAFNHMMDKINKLEESRQEFVSNVSHELKTPITSVKVLADSLLMQEDVPQELYREFLADIVDEINRESKIINDLLTLVKMDKTKSELNVEKVNINDFIEIILKRLRPLAIGKNIELVFESFRPVIAEVDETKLTLAISNLVENAIKYNVLDGWVHISLNADHKYFYVKVADSGIGIPEEEQERVFERFYRVDKTRSRETGGTGLGLSITKSVIQMHKGAIKLYSKEGEGTTFTIRIPLNYIS